MLKYILKRLASGVVLVFAICTITFVLMAVGAGDVGRERLGVNATQEQVDELNEELGRNDPVVAQYGSWLGDAVTGDFGSPWYGYQPVTDTIMQRLPVTLTLIIGTLAITTVVSALLGVLAATRGGWIDRAVQIIGVLGFAIPGFLIAFALVVTFSIHWQFFRATGYVRPSESITEWLNSITLPILALSFGGIAGLTLQIRGTLRDTLERDFVRTLRSRGLGSRSVVFKHAMRNSLAPALSTLGVQFIALFGGVVLIEQIFVIPGIGQTTVSAASLGDVPLVMGIVVMTGIIVVAVNLAVDLANAWLNPKVRLQ